eukprot:INCI14674.1.p1 GENE.INCI14674.1~~INCI14674.1.p1  ORF type:complete len:706 (-),score=158.07 INCI14674.1:334-2328(-)
MQKRKIVQAVPAVMTVDPKRGRPNSVAAIPAREVGMKQPPGVLDPEWEKMYSLLRSYVAEKHNARVPATLDTARFPKLGPWCVAQREAYKHEKHRAELGEDEAPTRLGRRISQQEIASLEAVGFEWGQTAWENKFELLKQWAAEHGTTRVPRGQVVNGVKLGKWVGTQRQAYRSEQLREHGQNPPKNSPRISPVQVTMLNSIGFEWGGLKPHDWDSKFELLTKFVNEHGHARVPVRLNTEEYPKLGVWVMQQRAAFRSGRLTVKEHHPKHRIPVAVIQDRVARLNGIGFEWSIPAPNEEEAKLRAERRAKARAEKRAKAKAERRLQKMLVNDQKQRQRALEKQRAKAEKAAARAAKKAEREHAKAEQKAKEKAEKAALREAKRAELAAARAEQRRQRTEERNALLQAARKAAAERGEDEDASAAAADAAANAAAAAREAAAPSRGPAVPVEGTFLENQPKLSPAELEAFKRRVAEKAKATAEANKAAKAERAAARIAARAARKAAGEDDALEDGETGRRGRKRALGGASGKKKKKKKKEIVYKNTTWELNLALLRSFVRENGHARVPTTLDTPDYPKLGQWVSYSRRAYRNELLRASGHAPGSTARITPERIARLNQLGFVWDPFEHTSTARAVPAVPAVPAASSASDTATAVATARAIPRGMN